MDLDCHLSLETTQRSLGNTLHVPNLRAPSLQGPM